MSGTKKSPWIIHYDGSSCNGCDIEVLAALTPLYDAERFGVINTGNPKHADIFVVTGSVNKQNEKVIKQIYDQMLEPKVVVACGACACGGGVYQTCYNVKGGVDTVIPVDAYVPGCAIRPESVMDAVVAGIELLEEKRKSLKANHGYSEAGLAQIEQSYIEEQNDVFAQEKSESFDAEQFETKNMSNKGGE